MAARVAVIGGGPLGLMALKTFREDGFDAILLESRDWVGGLWKYSDDSSLSAAENTVFNTSKYRASATDFPTTDDMDDFPTASQIYKYWNDYCDHFDLWPYIQLNSRVSAVRWASEKWELEIERGEAGVRREVFDKVALATGPFTTPKTPSLQSIESFSGNALHCMNFHNPSNYNNQNILVVGFHASSSDVISSLAGHANKVYVSHRSGLVLLDRYAPDGSVVDRMPPMGFMVFSMYLLTWFPALFYWMFDTLLGMASKKAYPNIPKEWGLTPAPSIAVSPPLMATQLLPHLQSGFCEPVPAIERITGSKTVELKSGRVLNDIDTIIYCTGYNFDVALHFEPKELSPYPHPGEPPNLYRNMFPLHSNSAIRNSLAFLGQGAFPYPGFSQFELQAMCVSQIWLRNSHLPDLSKMLEWRSDFLAWRASVSKRYNAQDTFYAAFLSMSDQIPWIDDVAGLGLREHFGWVERWTNFCAWEFWWRDRELYHLCLGGFPSPAIFRVFEGGKRKVWKGARQQILRDQRRLEEQQRRRRKAVMEEKKKKKTA